MDIERIRAETPGCAEVVHLNNAGAALPPAVVHDTVVDHLRLETRIGGYEAADAVADRLTESYEVLGRLVGACSEEIAYVENATRAWEMAFHAIPFKPGDRILTTTSEYASNALAFVQAAAQYRVAVEVVPDDEHGQLSLEALAGMLDDGGVRLVAINHVPTHDGLINPVVEVGRLARAAGALYLLDACQSIGQLSLDVTEIGCDLLSATGRKFLRGPRGTGFLYVRRDVLEDLHPPFVDLRAADWTGPDSYDLRPDARRFETWERFVAGQLGQARAAAYAMDIGLPAIEERVLALGAGLRAALAELPGVTVHDRGLRKSGIVTFTHADLAAAEIVGLLAERRITMRVAEQTYRYDAGRRPVPRVRASVHYYNTEEELDHATGVLAGLLG
ncbi:aminotransferase class V-fold PLP-dependent enzyme [Actinomadura sp. HBU206391]|uniref:aminotransferase class V-fold PLP-dependent enzyme n=1 Tax=Actinomadura sp. HBU206391 TaxID=2731692 RepID=UPI00164F300D|nr:aminotransferase class V-fold PLP-dependent enzyme [Actinomadura sp. HBU206391]MBC6460972.1 aminotransferase class V-fold PLP-dependent enzyme [Actinomadura sp. HBU206391]